MDSSNQTKVYKEFICEAHDEKALFGVCFERECVQQEKDIMCQFCISDIHLGHNYLIFDLLLKEKTRNEQAQKLLLGNNKEYNELLQKCQIQYFQKKSVESYLKSLQENFMQKVKQIQQTYYKKIQDEFERRINSVKQNMSEQLKNTKDITFIQQKIKDTFRLEQLIEKIKMFKKKQKINKPELREAIMSITNVDRQQVQEIKGMFSRLEYISQSVNEIQKDVNEYCQKCTEQMERNYQEQLGLMKKTIDDVNSSVYQWNNVELKDKYDNQQINVMKQQQQQQQYYQSQYKKPMQLKMEDDSFQTESLIQSSREQIKNFNSNNKDSTNKSRSWNKKENDQERRKYSYQNVSKFQFKTDKKRKHFMDSDDARSEDIHSQKVNKRTNDRNSQFDLKSQLQSVLMGSQQTQNTQMQGSESNMVPILKVSNTQLYSSDQLFKNKDELLKCHEFEQLKFENNQFFEGYVQQFTHFLLESVFSRKKSPIIVQTFLKKKSSTSLYEILNSRKFEQLELIGGEECPIKLFTYGVSEEENQHDKRKVQWGLNSTQYKIGAHVRYYNSENKLTLWEESAIGFNQLYGLGCGTKLKNEYYPHLRKKIPLNINLYGYNIE